jgi:hypothetical protein
MGQLERRRAQRRRRRMNTRVAAAACAVAAVVALSRIGPANTRTVNTIDGGDRTHPTMTTSTSLTGAAPAEQGSAPTPGGASNSTAGATPAVEAPLLAESTTTTPGAAGCAVESQTDTVDVTTPVGGAGFGGNQRTCDFIATQAGGYVAHGTWNVEVKRGKAYFIYKHNGEPFACAPVGTIQPGDHVSLTLTYGSDAAADPQYVRAGPDQHCTT